MAVRDVLIVEAGNGVMIASWPDLDIGDSGRPVALAGWPDKTIQIIGGTAVSMEGSNDGGTTWTPIYDTTGIAMTAITPGMYYIRDNPLLIRPNTPTGNNTSIVMNATR